jgi:hypothetical protein
MKINFTGINFTKGSSGLVGLVLVFIIIVVGVMGFLMLATEMNSSFDAARLDPTNSSGVLVHGELAGNITNETSQMAGDILPNFIWLIAAALVIAILFIVGSVVRYR